MDAIECFRVFDAVTALKEAELQIMRRTAHTKNELGAVNSRANTVASRKLKGLAVHLALIIGDRPEVKPRARKIHPKPETLRARKIHPKQTNSF